MPCIFMLVVFFCGALFSCNSVSGSADSHHHTEPEPIPGRSYYVSPMGEDTLLDDRGLSQEKPFQTIQFAHDQTEPGDTVYIMNGEYLSQGWQAALRCTRSGLPNGYISYKALEGHNPVIYTQAGANNTWSAIDIHASYIIIEGLVITGHNQDLSYNDALVSFESHQAGGQDWETMSQYNTCGIALGKSLEPVYNHHLIVRNCEVHDFPATGILGSYADYITIENCRVYNNSWYTMYGTSGISLYEIHNSSTSHDIRNRISGNLIYNNRCEIPYILGGELTDGNGIILDSYMLSNQDNPREYDGITVVENNVVFNNGGGGINVYLAANAIVRNNTVYGNCHIMNRYGDIFVAESTDVQVYNNISFAILGSSPLIQYNNSGFSMYNNLLNREIPNMDSASKVGDPLWIYPSVDPSLADFQLQQHSPAIDSGREYSDAPPLDFLGNQRNTGNSIDIGAIEYQ